MHRVAGIVLGLLLFYLVSMWVFVSGGLAWESWLEHGGVRGSRARRWHGLGWQGARNLHGCGGEHGLRHLANVARLGGRQEQIRSFGRLLERVSEYWTSL